MAFEVSSVPLSLTTMHGTPRSLGDPVELARDPQAGERVVDDQRQALPAEVVDHGQDAEAPAVTSVSATKSSDQRWFAPLRDRHRRPGSQSPLAAAALAHRQPLLAVEPESFFR